MPSRKKAKGKARKAAKEAAKVKESQAAVAADQRQEESLAAQTQRLELNDSATCQHGCPILSSPGEVKICVEFIKTFNDTFGSNVMGEAGAAFIAARETTEDKYPSMYTVNGMKTIVSILLSRGAQCIVDGQYHDNARLYAIWACYFEELAAVNMNKTKAVIKWSKIFELDDTDDHTLVQYFRKRIPCSCLDEKYKAVKSVKKLGRCCNPSCSLHARKAERSKMFYCTRCDEVNYCSIECQKENWKSHKEDCGNIVEVKAAFNSKQS